tara:strand:- start:61 stop:1125 length:1065 start_codon:yes stop_codon:yes gene_type:complete
MNDTHKFPYQWTLKDAQFTKDKGAVFSCFACGGGSTMGYKLAGFDVIGCNEIDPRMAECYKANHNPKYCFVEPIQTFKDRTDLPAELYDLDILDGSPPCSSFSSAGIREKGWGQEKMFAEGQSKQVLDTLFFDFVDLVGKLKPKIVIAENVKGLILGAAQKYVNDVLIAFDKAGYYVDFKLLNASLMGVPQRRERVFLYAIRKDLYRGPFVDLFQTQPELQLMFNEAPILFSDFYAPGIDDRPANCNGKMFGYWQNRKRGDESFADTIMRMENKERCFAKKYLYLDHVPMTYTSNSDIYLFDEYRKPNRHESCCIGSFPHDYNFMGKPYNYLVGMSVPPVMMAQIATNIYKQWL